MKHAIRSAWFAWAFAVVLLALACGLLRADTIRLPSGASLAAAVARAKPDDVIVLAPGTYQGGFKIRTPRITIRGETRNTELTAVIRGVGAEPGVPDGVIVYDGSHGTKLLDLVITGMPRAGVWVSKSDRVQVRGCLLTRNGMWGLFSSYSHDILAEYLECSYNGQHGIYISNSGDRPVVRQNRTHHNVNSGIQLNGDAKLANPALGDPRYDGVIKQAVVRQNKVWECSKGFNILCTQNSVIAENRIWYCPSGMKFGNDNNPSRTDVASKGNRVSGNEVWMRPGQGGYAVTMTNGSTNSFEDNTFITGARSPFEFDGLSWGWRSRRNWLYADPFPAAAVKSDGFVQYTLQQLVVLKIDVGSRWEAPRAYPEVPFAEATVPVGTEE